MARNNDVFQILVTKGNQVTLPKNKKVTDLLPGQIGVFNFSTNLSVDNEWAGSGESVPKFYVAVGVDKDGDGVTDDIVKSRGSYIPSRGLVAYSYRPHTAGQHMKVVLKDYTADCETEYGIKLELRNQEIYRSQGYNQFTKTYSIKTACCKGCEQTCPSGDANEITKLLFTNISSDSVGLVKANILPRGSVAAAGVTPDVNGYLTLAQVDTIMAYNATQTDPADYVYTNLEIETITQKINSFCEVNLKYFYPRETVAIVTKIEGFKCNGAVEVTQQAAFEEGSGYDIKQLEYKTLGWDVSPYRLSTLNGVADQRTYNTVASEKYDQIVLTYDQFSIGAWLEYLNNEATIIAVPEADTVTRDNILWILDTFSKASGLDALEDDAALASTNPTVVEPTSLINDVNKDGIA